MKYQRVNQNTKNAMRLQSVGWVKGSPANEIKKGDFLLWNFGTKSEVLDIVAATSATITIKEKSGNYVGTRKMTKKRLVCILEDNDHKPEYIDFEKELLA